MAKDGARLYAPDRLLRTVAQVARCGTRAAPVGRRLARGSRILAFEPLPRMADRLRVNVALNKLAAVAEVHQVARGASMPPDAILLDLCHRHVWERDILCELADAGFACASSGNGDALYSAASRPGPCPSTQDEIAPREAAPVA